MTDLRVDVPAVRALAGKVLDGADLIDQIHWPTIQSDEMPGSAVADAATASLLEGRVAELVAHLRTWAAAVQASAMAIDGAQTRHARELGGGR